MNEVLSLGRAARRFGVTQAWLRAEAQAGRVPHLRAGTLYLFDNDALSEVLAMRAAGEAQQHTSKQEVTCYRHTAKREGEA